ncbi:MAG TPA: GntR family transcriptional regulator, partial [Clostridiales bacterium]|nr:GntR family transcriptional regulator [Clostridiales bacterium]
MLNFQNIKLNNRIPVYVQIALYVKQQILLGKVVSGDELPSRREIAAQLNINPNTAQKAFKLMEEEGYVLTNGNQGSIIYIDESVLSKIKTELTNEMVNEFISSAREINLSFKDVIDLISKFWDGGN